MEEAADHQAATLAAATNSQNPELGLRAVAALRGLLETLEVLQVDSARAQGWSWQEIATRLGVSKQAVHQKHGRRARPQAGR
jgi:DNA-directed RNA polymerase specialized sigma24 family protein